MNDLERQLEDASSRMRAIEVDASLVAKDRKRLIVEALAAGMRPSKVAQLSGLSRQRIQQITSK